MRVALFGGSFDPPHHGHIAIAEAAADAFALDEVLFAPVGNQPLKANRLTTPFSDRLAMVELACRADARFVASNIDAPKPDGAPNYTVDTLATLHEIIPAAHLFNLVGADSFLDLPHWREPDRLLELAEWIVVSRPGFPLTNLAPLGLNQRQLRRVHLLETVHEDVAATGLRARLEMGDVCTDILSPAVCGYIQSHHLYR